LHEVMREALAELPKGARAIFISRSEPPPAFARLRAQRAMEIVDWPQLKFTPMETTGLIRKLTPGRWSKNAIANLQTATDGWAAGLVLSLEQLRSWGETPEKPTEESSEVLFDYFAGEIFKKADPVTQEVLLQTSFVPRVTAAIAAKLTGHVDAGEILARLHKQNYFTNKLAGGEPTDNARLIEKILGGGGPKGARAATVLNAAAAIYVSGRVRSFADGVAAAEKSITSGAATRVLDNMRRAYGKPALTTA